jgi:hypothetical protein
MVDFGLQSQFKPSGGGDIDMLAQANGLNANLGKMISVLQSRFALGAFTGSFVMPAAATFVIADANVKAGSVIVFEPTSGAAAQLQGSTKQLYVSARTVGTNFTAATGDGTAASGGQTFNYILLNVG